MTGLARKASGRTWSKESHEMEFSVSTDAPDAVPCDAIAVGVFAGGALQGAAHRLDEALGGVLSASLAEEKFEAKPGSTAAVHTHGRIAAARVIVSGLGAQTEFTLDRLRQAAAAAVRRTGDPHAGGLAPAGPPVPPPPGRAPA